MAKKFEPCIKEYDLKPESIDALAAFLEESLFDLRMEKANVLRIRLSMEEALLSWQDHFGVDQKIIFRLRRVFGRPILTLELRGEPFNPIEDEESLLGDWCTDLLGTIGLSPRYHYQAGTNFLRLQLHRPRLNPGVNLLIAVIMGVFVGFVCRTALPEAVREMLIVTLLTPMEEVFFRLLSAAAGPVIFLTVLSSVCGLGSVASMSKSGKRLLFRFIGLSTLVTLVCMLLSIPFHRLDFMWDRPLGTDLGSGLDFLLQIIPRDILSPFLETDSPQLIVLALIIGNALLVTGSQTRGLVSLIDQANSVGLLVAEWVSRLIPYFVFFLLVLGIWDGTVHVFRGIWKPLILFHVFAAGCIWIAMMRVGRNNGVRVSVLWHKIRESFMIALKKASVNDAYGENRYCCERKLGIQSKMCDYGLPLGLVIYMPISTMSLMVVTMYAGEVYNVEVSLFWYSILLALVVTLQAASPPVSGVDLLAYSVIFARLGIPSDALLIAMVADTCFCFLFSAGNQAMLQMEMIGEAKRLKVLDIARLRKG